VVIYFTVWDMDAGRPVPDLVDEYEIPFINRQGFPQPYNVAGVRTLNPTR